MGEHVVGMIEDIPPNSRKVVEVRGREIVIFNVNGRLSALLNKCPHEGAKLCFSVQVGLTESSTPGTYEYSRPGEFIRCPWHGWEFEIESGQSYCDPNSIWVRKYAVKVVDGEDLIEGPFKVEKFEVSVKGKYVVIEM